MLSLILYNKDTLALKWMLTFNKETAVKSAFISRVLGVSYTETKFVDGLKTFNFKAYIYFQGTLHT
jgi:hypothetical protein